MNGFVVTEEINGARRHDDYALLPGDLLVREEDGSYWKECPGLSIGGFHLTPEQVATLRAVEYQRLGLNYVYDAGWSRDA
jgi:hypothetical protein